jgi:tRNA dimethylallyltransferase
MDIGTAKPSPDERATVPHHLIDIVDPSVEFSVAQYVDAVSATVADVRSRGKEPLFVGGTPLYLKSLLRGLFDGPPADWQMRHEIEQELEQVGQPALYDRLVQIDPVAASNIHPHDKRRLIRALEVHRATGQPISHQQLQFEEGRPAEECRVLCAAPRGAAPTDRSVRRWSGGLVEEVRQLTSVGELGRTAARPSAIESCRYLTGEYDHDEMVARITYRTGRPRSGGDVVSKPGNAVSSTSREVNAEAIAAWIAEAAS